MSQKGEFDVDEESLAAMKEQIAQRGVDLVVDYEHQTLTGERAPAAGWVKELFAEDGHIKARVEWTIPAKQYLENKEYRYLSPVITVRKSDNKATGLHSLALTNTPAIAGMTPIVNSSTFQGGETNMNELIKKIAAALGLGEDADEEQILTALSACVEENKALKEAAEGGKAPGKKPARTASPKTRTTASSRTSPSVSSWASRPEPRPLTSPLPSWPSRAASMGASRPSRRSSRPRRRGGRGAGPQEREDHPAQRGWAKGYALKSPDGFKEFLEKAPQAVPMSEIAGGDALALKGDKPDEATMLVCKQLGVSAEDVQKYGMKEE